MHCGKYAPWRRRLSLNSIRKSQASTPAIGSAKRSAQRLCWQGWRTLKCRRVRGRVAFAAGRTL